MSLSICLSFDFDALSIWITTFKQPTPSGLSRGEFGARVGMPRILDVLARQGVSATFFVPAHTARTFPDAVRRIFDMGHEIAAHGDVHETPVGLDRASEAAILDRAGDDLAAICGHQPLGYRSPAWDLSPHTIGLLEERGYLYDSSLMSDDYTPFRPRRADIVEADGAIRFGPEANLWELPVAWELDDYPYFHFLSRPYNQGLRAVGDVYETWLEEFRSCLELAPEGVFTLTLHPEIIGRGPRIRMLDRLIGELKRAPNAEFLTMREAAGRRSGTHRPDTSTTRKG
jgi:peptidoglycan/xylan/chitin deacetylase (PgdA/CDA1 family)